MSFKSGTTNVPGAENIAETTTLLSETADEIPFSISLPYTETKVRKGVIKVELRLTYYRSYNGDERETDLSSYTYEDFPFSLP